MKPLGKIIRWVLVVAACAGTAWAGEPIHETRSARPNGTVEVDLIAGTVQVIGWDRGEVEVTGTLGRGSKALEIEKDGDTIHIEVVLPSGRNNNVEGSDIVIRIPHGSRLEVDTVAAPIDVENLTGRLELATVAGAIRIEGGPTEVDANSVAGKIVLESGANLRHGDFQTVSGKIEVTADFDSRGRFELETVTGSIELYLPRGVDAEIDAATFSGRIRNDLGPAAKREKYGPSEELSFRVGSGGARISLRSFSGSISIRGD